MTETTHVLNNPDTEFTVRLLSKQSANNAATAVHLAEEVEELRKENEQLREELSPYKQLAFHLDEALALLEVLNDPR